jgi:hypothetical protein
MKAGILINTIQPCHKLLRKWGKHSLKEKAHTALKTSHALSTVHRVIIMDIKSMPFYFMVVLGFELRALGGGLLGRHSII